MKHSYFRFLILMTVIGFMISGCSTLKEPELVSIEIVELSRTSGEGTLKVNVVLLNPNSKPLTIKKIDIDGRLNQKSVGNFSLTKRDQIDKRAEKTIEAIFNFNPDHIYTGFLSKQFGAIGSKSVRITLSGEAEFLKEEKEMLLPLEYSEIYKIKN